MDGQREGLCRTCRFWDGERDGPKGADEDGHCRRRSPVPSRRRDEDEDYDRFPSWPLTMADEWCGEWQPMPVQQK